MGRTLGEHAMPTNPLWLEHTEKAAWDTVQTLRRQIEAERARVQQLLRLQQDWPRILNALSEAKATHAICAEGELGVIDYLSAELSRTKRECGELTEKLGRAPLEQERARLRAAESSLGRDRSSEEPALARFFQQVKEYAAENEPLRPRSQERLIAALEDKLEELEQAPRRDVGQHAIEIAYLAFRIATNAAR
jgi:hypothetical protein